MGTTIGHQFNINEIQIVGVPEVKTTFNQFDEHGLVANLARIRGETNWEYKRRIMDVFVHCANSSYIGLIHGITRELGLPLFQPLRINPKVNSVGEFLAADPYIKFDGVYLYLYSDYSNGLLDYQIDRFAPGGNYEYLIRLVNLINSTYFFEASLISGYDPYTPSMTIINQSNRIAVSQIDIPISRRFKLDHPKLVKGSLLFSDRAVFSQEVSSESSVTSAGKYWVNYNKGIIRCYSTPNIGTVARYEYNEYPFMPMASHIILHDINNDNFRVKMFEQVLQDNGTYAHGIPTELGVDIINELLSVYPMYWGV